MGTIRAPHHAHESDDRLGEALGLLSSAAVDLTNADRAQLRHLPGGWSRHSYVLEVPGDVAASEFIIRVKPPGTLLDTDIAMEYALYEMLQDHDVPTPRVFGFQPDAANSFGGPFFLMERLPGHAPNVWQRRDRAELEADWAAGGSLGGQLADILAGIHTIQDPRAATIAETCPFDDLVAKWQAVWERVCMRPDPVMDEVWPWLLSRAPRDVRWGLVHGDYRIGNTLVHEKRISGVIDWELSHWGDTRFDIGYVVLKYLAGKFFRVGSDLVSAVADVDWFLERYERSTGLDIDHEVVRTYSAFGAAILMTILATGAYEFAQGNTTDIRMAWNRFAMPGLRQDLTGFMDW
jgi:aminoglycoside phosphotransferase (APT) family kinase protein